MPSARSPGPWTLVVALLLLPHSLPAQRVVPDSAGPLVLEQEVRERWLPRSRAPHLVPFESRREVTHLRWRGPRRGDGPSRWHHLEAKRGNVEARLSVEPDGDIFSLDITPPPLRYRRYQDAAERSRSRRRRLRSGTVLLELPFSRFAEIPFPVPDEPVQPGSSWVDTLALTSEPGEEMRETLEGVWQYEVVGDTTMDGGTFPVIRSRAEVRYTSTDPFDDASIDGTLLRTRALSGTLRGRAVVDTAKRLRLRAADTATWEGEEVLELEDGTRLHQPATYERVRTWILRDSLVWRVRQDSLRERQARQRTGMLVLPVDSLATRLRRGHPGLVDSLLGAWRASVDPDERQRLIVAVERWALRDRSQARTLDRRLRRLRLEAGDTLAALRELGRDLSSLVVTDEDLDLLLPWLDDPAALHRIGAFEEWTWLTPAESLLRRWPVGGDPPETRPCTPSACGRLLQLVHTATEPRLRDLGLVLSYMEDPARWHDTLEARSAEGSRIVRRALVMGHGIGATWPAAPGIAVPPPDAPWRAWLAWMGGEVRWGASHLRAVRLFEIRTGRDVAAELLRQWPPPPAAGDSARLAIGTVLQRLGALPDPEPDELAGIFLTGSSADRRLARHELAELLGDRGETAPPALVRTLLYALIDSIAAGGDAPWPAVDGLLGGDERVLPRVAASSHGVGGVPRFLLAENLPPAMDLPSHIPVEIVTREDWDDRPLREGGWLLRFHPVRVVGPFVDLSWTWTVLEARAPDESPSGYAGGGGLRLVRTEAGWRVVDRSGWIT